MRRMLPALALTVLTAAGAYALVGAQGWESAVLVESDAPRVNHKTDHGTGIQSEWGLTISEPLFDQQGAPVRALAYNVTFQEMTEGRIVARAHALKIVSSRTAEVVENTLTAYPLNVLNNDDGILPMYRFAFQPAEGLSWGDVETVLDYTASVTYEPVALPTEMR